MLNPRGVTRGNHRLLAELGAPRHTFQSDRVHLRIWFPNDALVVQRLEGHADLEVISVMLRHLDDQLARGTKLAIFDDFEELVSYDSDARIAITDWAKEHLPALSTMAILTRSKLVSMGTAVANLALGGRLRAYTNRARFEAALAAELRRD